MTAPLASWHCPSWSTSSRVYDGEVVHARSFAVPATSDDGRPCRVGVEVAQRDEFTCDVDMVRVERLPVEVRIEDLTFTLEQAWVFVRALDEALQAVGALQ